MENYLDVNSFEIMNGRCYVTSDSIYFKYDDEWKSLERFFGKPFQRRNARLLIVPGILLICFSLACFALGFWLFGIYPLLLGLFLLVIVPACALACEDYLYPDRISKCDIQEITASSPTRMRPSLFTITFTLDGHRYKMWFGLPNGRFSEQLKSFQDISETLVACGLMPNTGHSE